MAGRRDAVEDVGQLFCVGFEGTSPSPFVREFIAAHGGGVILFRRNMASAEQILDLNVELRALAPVMPLLSLVDQEGGAVLRLGDVGSPVPAMASIGALGEPSLARKVGRLLGRELRALGFNANAAPVLDVHTNPSNPIIGARAFSPDPGACGRLGASLIQGLQEEGVLACAKHFPGHGDTDADSHRELPRLEHDRARLEAVELVPFRHVFERTPVAMVMTAHVLYEGVDPAHPATLSPLIIRDILRGALGYEGLVITDDIEMAALAERYSPEEIVERGLDADVDMFLICRSEEVQRRCLEHARALVADGRVSPERISRSLRRIHRAKGFLHSLPVATHEDRTRWLRAPEHLAFLAGLEPS